MMKQIALSILLLSMGTVLQARAYCDEDCSSWWWWWGWQSSCSPGQYYTNQCCDECCSKYYYWWNSYCCDHRYQCSNCNKGRYTENSNQGSCTKCDAGKYADGQGNTGCTPCAPGRFQDNEGQSGCKQCPEGKTSGKGQSKCYSCPAGQYEYESQNTCRKCPQGESSSSGSTSCEQCPAGQYANEKGISPCIDCPLGYFQRSKGKDVCVRATLGHFAPRKGMKEQKPCPLGKYGPTRELKECKPCPAGRYCDDQGISSTPPKCPAGRYSEKGAKACNGECPAGLFCPPGTAENDEEDCGSVKQYCPAGAQKRQSVEEGYYTAPLSAKTTRREKQVKCEEGYYCVDGERQKCDEGFYGSETGLTKSTCSGSCKDGFLCPAGSTNAKQEPCSNKNPVKYCTNGEKHHCGANSYTTPENANPSHRTGCEKCSVEYACHNGLRVKKLKWKDAHCDSNPRFVFAPEIVAPRSTDTDIGDPLLLEARASYKAISYDIVSVQEDGRKGDGRLCTDEIIEQSPFQIETYLDKDTTYHPNGDSSNKAISQTKGQLQISSGERLEFATCDKYTLKVKARFEQSNDVVLNRTCSLSVGVEFVNSAPRRIDNDAKPLKITARRGQPFNESVGEPLQQYFVDPNGDELSFQLTEQTERRMRGLGTDDSMFFIEACSGQIRVGKPLALQQTEEGSTVVLHVVVSDGHPESTGKLIQDVHITVKERNRPPRLNEPLPVLYVVEGADKGTAVGTKSDKGSTEVKPITHSNFISDPDNDDITVKEGSCVLDTACEVFAISTDGVVEVENPKHLDYNIPGTLPGFLPVIYSDKMSGSTSASLKIYVEELREAPVITTTSFDVKEEIDGEIGKLSATDNHGDQFEYSILNAVNNRDEHEPRISISGSKLYASEPFHTVRCDSAGCEDCKEYDKWVKLSIQANVTNNKDSMPGPTKSEKTEIRINVQPIPHPPRFVQPSENLTIEEANEEVDIDISVYFCDVDGHIIFYDLEIEKEGAALPFILGKVSGILTVDQDGGLDYEMRNRYTIGIRASDSTSPEDFIDVELDLFVVDKPETPKVVTSSVQVSELATPENGAVAVIQAKDPDIYAGTDRPYASAPSSFEFIQFSHEDSLQVTSETGEISILAKHAIDYESLFPSPHLDLNIEVKDTKHEIYSELSIVRVNIIDMPEPPYFSPQNQNFSMDIVHQENVLGTVKASDPDIDDDITYRLVEGPNFLELLPSNGLLLPIPEEGNSTGNGLIEFGIDVGDVFEVIVEIEDSYNLTSLSTHIVRVVEEQTPPRWKGIFYDYFNEDLPYSLGVPEHYDGIVDDFKLNCEDPNGGEVQYSIQSANPVEFSRFFRLVADSGRLEVIQASALDFFSMEYRHGILNVICTDSTNKRAPVGKINVTVLDVPQPPKFQNIPLDTLMELPEDTQVGATLTTLEAFDPDISSTYSLSFAVTLEGGFGEEEIPAGTTQPLFDNDGHVAYANVTLSSSLDYNGKNFYRLNVSVVDQSGLIDSVLYEMEVQFVNSPPSFDQPMYNLTVDENFQEGVPLTPSFGFTDRTPFDREINYQFEVIWTDSPGFFEFSGNNIILAPGACLDYETRPEHHAQIQVVDEGGLSDTANVTIFVRDVNDISVDEFISPVLSTEGGDTIKFIGEDLAPEWRMADVWASLMSDDDLFYAISDCQRRFNGSLWLSTEIECQAPEGIGKDLQWTLHVDRHSHTSPRMRSSYAKPRIKKLSSWPLAASTIGDQSFSLEGTQFGPLQIVDVTATSHSTPIYVTYRNSLGVEYGAVGCNITSAHIMVTCHTTEGTGDHLQFRIVVGPENRAWSQSTEWFSPAARTHYALPEILEVVVKRDHFPTTGISEAVKLLGTNFGPRGTPIVATMTNGNYSLTATCPARKHIHTTAVCDLPPGVGVGYLWVVEISELKSTLSDEAYSISYDPPRISEITDIQGSSPRDLDTKGGEVALIAGSNLGPRWHYPLPITILYGANLEYSAKDCTLETEHTVIECSTVEGIGKLHHWKAIIGRQESNMLQNVSNYHRPIVGTYRRELLGPIGEGTDNFRTQGEEKIIIGGSFFGPSGTIPDRVKYGKGNETFEARECEVVNHENLRCLTAAGAGDEHLWKVGIGRQESEVSTTGYAIPQISRFEGVNGSIPESLNTLGGDEIDIVGNNFGPPSTVGDFLEAVTFGRRGSDFTAKSCRVLSHGRIRCTVGEGTGSQHQWIVKVAGQRSKRSYNITNYATPAINCISPSTGPTGFSITKGTMPRIQVQGHHFGINLLQKVDVSVLFDTGGQFSLLYSPDSRNISDILAEFLDIQPFYPLDFVEQAKDQGLDGDVLDNWLQSITEIPVDTSMIQWESTDTETQKIEFPLPEGFGANRPVMVRVDGKISHPSWFTYDAPRITNVAPSLPTGGMFDVVIDGKNFCGGSSCSSATCCGTVYVDGDVVEVPDHGYSHEQIRMTIPDDEGQSKHELRIEVRGQPSSTETTFGEIAPSISGQEKFKEWPAFNTSGGEALTLYNVRGVDRGTKVEDISVEIGGRSCNVQERSLARIDGVWKANVTCLTPEHVGKRLSVNLKINGFSSPNNQFTVDYASPTVCLVQLSPDNLDNVVYVGEQDICSSVFGSREVAVTDEKLPTIGGELLIQGRNFGSESLGMVAVVDILGLSSINITEHTHSLIRATLPDGSGSNLPGTFYIRDPSNAASFEISFNPPSILYVSPDAIPTLVDPTTDSITIYGSNFGPSVTGGVKDASVLVAGDTCTIVQLDHNEITCIPPNGQGDKIEITVVVSSQSTSESILSYKPAVMRSIFTENEGNPTSGKTVEGEPVKAFIIGENFGTHGSVCFKKKGDDCSEDNVISDAVFNHTVVAFDLPPGYGMNIVEVHVDGWSSVEAGIQSPPGSVTFTYDPPEVYRIDPFDSKLSNARDCTPFRRCFQGDEEGEEQCVMEHPPCFPTVGGVPIRLLGKNFGPHHSVVEIRISNELCQLHPLHQAKMDHDRVFCMLTPGIGTNIEATVTVGTATSTVTASFSYDPPRVDTVKPNILNAEGETIMIQGENFSPGGTSKDVSVLVGGLSCLNPLVADATTIECTTQADTVGPKSINLTVAEREVFFPLWRELIIAKCEQHWYGLVGEECLYCPEEEVGAVCPGGELKKDLIYADEGFWRVNDSTPSDRCHEKRQSREQCPVFLGCIPTFACLGNNTCAEGYTSSRCSQCVEGTHFRMSGECVRCPEHAWLLGVMFALAAIGATIGGYLINAKQIQLAAFTIGLDYFQVVAIFARTRVDWPTSVERVFQVLSFFNFNLELAAPECYVKPAPPYEVRWISMMAIPLAAATLLFVVYVIHYLYKLCILRRPANKRHTHVNALIATLIIIMYVLYLFLARMTLDVFNCVPADPPDGNLYMSGNTDIICGESNVHVNLLLPLALVTFAVYVASFPVGSFLFLKKNKEAAKRDQILRAHGQGTSPLSNPNYVFRRRYQRLYYLFKPGKWYWITLILLRKLLIALTALMFRSTPTYQLGMSLLVIFSAFTLQIRHEPYMSRHQYQEVLNEHDRKVREGDEMHMRIQSVTNERSAEHAKRAKTMPNDISLMGYNRHGIPVSPPVVRLLTDYNVVESLLLGSALLVSLSGIMLLSGRFDGKNKERHRAEFEALGILTVTVIVLSCVYFLLVFVFELLSTFRPKLALRLISNLSCGKKVRAHSVEGVSKESTRASLSSMSLPDNKDEVYDAHVNPLVTSQQNAYLKGGQSADDTDKDLPQLKQRLEDAREEIRMLRKMKAKEYKGNAEADMKSGILQHKVPDFNSKRVFDPISSSNEALSKPNVGENERAEPSIHLRNDSSLKSLKQSAYRPRERRRTSARGASSGSASVYRDTKDSESHFSPENKL